MTVVTAKIHFLKTQMLMAHTTLQEKDFGLYDRYNKLQTLTKYNSALLTRNGLILLKPNLTLMTDGRLYIHINTE